MSRELGIETTLGEEEMLRTIEDPNATIEPNRSADSGGLHALEELAQMTSGRTLESGLEMKKTLGEGGMGIVHLAMQRSLGREVAVKTLRPELRSEAAVLRILREAWVTGSLEHPNVVPVYDLALDAKGAPVIVLKRIEGVSWDALMQSPEEIERRFGEKDALAWNLGILVRVASALSLAHSRGIVHRDLKPENVMVGSFGEVYLVDWGIAVSLRDDPTGRVPTSRTDLAGTPAYMAPEMFGLDGGRVTERSDIYLLGGILHEVLTGRPPHRGGTIHEMLVSAANGRFEFPEAAPKALVAIAERALAREPRERFESVQEFQQRIEWFLRHRGSLALSDEAYARLAELERAIEGAAHDRVHPLFSECRFGFRAALRASEDNEAAREGLRRATEAVVRYELAGGSAKAAAAALAELVEPPAELAHAVAQAMAREEAEHARLAHIEADQDPNIGRRTRAFVAIVLVSAWTIAPLAGQSAYRRAAETSEATARWIMTLWSLVMAGLVVTLALWARESMRKTALNRSTAAIALSVFAIEASLELGAGLMNIPHARVLVLRIFAWFAIATMIGLTIEARFRLAAFGFLAAFLVAAARPELVWWMQSASNAFLGVVLYFAWARGVGLRRK